MSIIKTDAIILKGFKYGDSSKIVTIFSADSGKFSAIVKGVRNSKSKFSGVFETMNYISLIYNKKENRDLQIISNAECVSTFPEIKENFEKLMIAYKLSDLTSRMMFEYDVSNEVFHLLLNVLTALNNTKTKFDILYVMYQVKFAIIQGINPVQDTEPRNFLEQKFVLRDKDSVSSKNLFSDDSVKIAVNNLEKAEPFDIEKVEIEDSLVNKLQNAYDFHYMIHSDRYGINRSRQIIDELLKKQ